MQIEVNIDEELLRDALQASGMPSSAAVIERGLRIIIVLSHLDDVLDMLPSGIEDPSHH